MLDVGGRKNDTHCKGDRVISRKGTRPWGQRPKEGENNVTNLQDGGPAPSLRGPVSKAKVT
jgi:hypothetical protein